MLTTTLHFEFAASTDSTEPTKPSNGPCVTFTFCPICKEDLRAYVETGDPLDKAGAYGIQDGYPLVKSYDGSYENVVGLPLEEVRALLNRAYGGDTYVKTCD